MKPEPVWVEPATPSVNVAALMVEITERLRHLLATGEDSAIDLGSLPLTPSDRDELAERLGAGEVSIRLVAEGESAFVETVFPGVWRVTHRNPAGKISLETIEIAYVPALVGAHREDVAAGLEQLEQDFSIRM